MNIVIVNCFDTYEHRTDLLYDVMVSEGHCVTIVTSDFRHFEKIKRKEEKKDYIFINAKPYRKNLSYQRLRSHKQLSKDVFKYLEEQESHIDLLWVLIPPNSFAKDAAIYKDKHPKTRLILDLIDLWPETMPIGIRKDIFPLSIWKNLRDHSISKADVVVTECNLFHDILEKVLEGIETETLYLARPPKQYIPNLNLPKDKTCLCYLGSINNIIDIDSIVDVIKCFREQHSVELHIVGDGERKDELVNASINAGAEVIFHGRVYDRDEKQKIFDSCHYGLNIMKKTVCVGLTMKSMDYMEFGLPLLNNIHGDTWEIIISNQIGYNIDENFKIPDKYDFSLRKNTRRVYQSMFSINTFNAKVIHLLEEMRG